MQQTNVRTGNSWQRPVLPTPRVKIIDLVLGLLGLVLAATFAIAWWMMRAPSPAAPLNDANLASPGNASVAAMNLSFEQNMSDLVSIGSPESFQVLLQFLKQSEPLSHRSVVLTALQDASLAVVPVLMSGLNDEDQGVRAGAAQLLGLRREYRAIGALRQATRDQDAGVRRQAVISLGEIDAWQALPRLEQLLVNEPNSDVRKAAKAAKESFRKEIALEIGVPAGELLALSVTSGDLPHIYAVTSTDLYTRYGAAWALVSRLPDAPLVLATGAEPTLIYLSTLSAGLFRSLDGGETWQYVQFGLQTQTRLDVTAIVVDPQNSQQVFIALAAQGADVGAQDPMGISASIDGGTTFWFLEDSPTDAVISRLVMDLQWQGVLFGMTLDTPWSYAYSLPTPSPVSIDPIGVGEASE